MNQPVTTPVPAERPHHPYSPSKLQYLEACPRYASRSGKSEASEAGTRLHKAAETGSIEGLNEEEISAVAMCLDYRDDLIEQYPGGTTIEEIYLPIDDEVIEHEGVKWKGTSAGYLDFAVLSADKTEVAIIDYKFGRWAVEDSENNLQGMAYMLGLVHKFPTIKRARVFFLMPRRDEISSASFQESQFQALLLRITTVVSRARDPQAPARPNVGTCLFCANIAKCDALHPIVLNIGKKFAPLKIPENISPTLLADPAQASDCLKIAQIVKTWAEAYRSQCTAKAVEDDFTPAGYDLTLVTPREVTSVKLLRETALQMVSQEVLDYATEIHFGKIEKSISEASPRGQKKAAIEAFQKAIEAAGAVVKGKPYPVLKLSA